MFLSVGKIIYNSKLFGILMVGCILMAHFGGRFGLDLLFKLINFIVPVYFLANSFIFALLYIWCKRRPAEIITFYFGIKVKSNLRLFKFKALTFLLF